MVSTYSRKSEYRSIPNKLWFEDPPQGAEVHCFKEWIDTRTFAYLKSSPTTATSSVYVMHYFTTIYNKLYRSIINTYYIYSRTLKTPVTYRLHGEQNFV